ncbi:MAG: ABC transporter ATP-binding protein, partial [Miltoncostaeaceae bacterium]
LRMIATLLRPDSGTLRVAGHDCPARASRARPHLGVLGHEPQVYRDLSALQNLEFFAALHGLARDRERDLDALDRVGLIPRANDPVRTFSRGMGQRLGLARLLLHDPPILLLDEPHAGLDAPGTALLDRLIRGRPPHRGILLVTHEVERGIALADRAMVLRAGRLVMAEDVAGADPAGFRRRYEALIA